MTTPAVEGPFAPSETAAVPAVTIPGPLESAAAAPTARHTASYGDLLAKKRRRGEVTITTKDDNGDDMQLVVKLQAMSSKAYDDLVAKCPPTTAQRTAGAPYNTDSFVPGLLAACMVDPVVTLEQATELYTSPEWSSGEIGDLFYTAQRVCNAGLDVPFIVSG